VESAAAAAAAPAAPAPAAAAAAAALAAALAATPALFGGFGAPAPAPGLAPFGGFGAPALAAAPALFGSFGAPAPAPAPAPASARAPVPAAPALCCRQCKAPFTVPSPGGVRSFECISFVDSLAKAQKSSGGDVNRVVKCDLCEDEDAAMYCVDDSENLCSSCSKLHKKSKASASHHQIP